jgi:lactoylglutathione lyase
MGEETSKFRLLHIMIRVLNLENSIDFYTRHLGMSVLRRTDYSDGKFTLVFVGYGNEKIDTVLELTHNWDETDPYEVGSGFGHLAVAVPNIYEACDLMRLEGVTISREPGPMKHGKSIIAFIEDPDGYKVELIERD